MQIDGIEDIPGLFEAVSSDQKIAKMVRYSETLDLARQVGVRIAKKSYIRELDLVAMVRKHLLAGTPPRPCAGCALEGRRWYKINQGIPMKYRIDRESMAEAFPDAVEAMEDAIRVVKSIRPEVLIEEVSAGELPDVAMRSENIDGRFGTLGFALTYVSDETDDLDLGGDRWVSAELVCDNSEAWDYAFFFTVFLHELCHILGIDHAPDSFDDIMRAFYAGARRTLGPWTERELEVRYKGVIPA